jgi:hypothetical protein
MRRIPAWRCANIPGTVDAPAGGMSDNIANLVAIIKINKWTIRLCQTVRLESRWIPMYFGC